MAERRMIVDNLTVVYQGLFNLNELYLVIDKWYREKGYDKFEKKNYEQVYKTGKEIELEIEPWKKITDYAKIVLKMKIFVKNLKDVTIEKEGHKVKMNEGDVKIAITGYLDTDYEHKWEKKPLVFFLRTMFDQYIYKLDHAKDEAAVADDAQHVHSLIKSYLNMHRF